MTTNDELAQQVGELTERLVTAELAQMPTLPPSPPQPFILRERLPLVVDAPRVSQPKRKRHIARWLFLGATVGGAIAAALAVFG